ncbi:hypothetical protein UK23_15410 [Lentzea aerocolonigenes]|uniref:Apea-like HEPN domain-containing protein n=1 Tax=Lentzea aerocolonigenes TaxID=68170 RepID=A0A0F0GZN9_LENAE|nr:hypothetical protein [Lentzea aerocolonigenes]KJK48914.1 hypothetical protein UK23_15410 [Lentzea aerocolonigenes]
MAGTISGFYLRQTRDLWLCGEPEGWAEIMTGKGPWSHEVFTETVWSHEIDAGISISGQRQGTFEFDFAGYPSALTDWDEGDSPSAFDFDELLRATRVRVNVMNAFALALHSAFVSVERHGAEPFSLTHTDLYHRHPSGNGIGGNAILGLPNTPEDKWRAGGAVSAAVMDKAADLLNQVLQHEAPGTLDLIVLVNQALVAHTKHDFAGSIIAFWTVCEALQNQLWKSYYEQQIAAAGGTVSKKRREKLNGRDFTASIVSEILGLAGVLPAPLHASLDENRILRNKWLHGGKIPTYIDSGKCGETVKEMLRLTLGIDLPLALSIGASGL